MPDDFTPAYLNTLDKRDGARWRLHLEDERFTQAQNANPVEAAIQRSSQKYGLDPNLLRAVIQTESNGNPRAVSKAGAEGLMQLMPGTARRFGVRDSFDIQQNVDGGAQYLRYLANLFPGDTERQLAAYNAGEGNVKHYGGIPPFAETQAYVPKVLAAYQQFSGGAQLHLKDPGAQGAVGVGVEAKAALETPLQPVPSPTLIDTKPVTDTGTKISAVQPGQSPPGSPFVDQVPPEPSVADRLLRDVGQGALDGLSQLAQMPETMLRATGIPKNLNLFGLESIATATSELSRTLSETSRDLRAPMTPPDEFLDKVAKGVGGALPGLAAGIASAGAASAFTAVSPTVARIVGATANGVLSGGQAAAQYYDSMKGTLGETEAAQRAMKLFAETAVVDAVLNKAGIYGEQTGVVARAVAGARAGAINGAIQYDLNRREYWVPADHKDAAALKSTGWKEADGKLYMPFSMKDMGEQALIGGLIGGPMALAAGEVVGPEAGKLSQRAMQALDAALPASPGGLSLVGGQRGSVGGRPVTLTQGAEGLSNFRYKDSQGRYLIPRDEIPPAELELKDFIRAQGGIKIADDELHGEFHAVLSPKEAGVYGLLNNASGLTPSRMAERAAEHGFLPSADKEGLLRAIDRAVTQGHAVFSADATGHIPMLDDPVTQSAYAHTLEALRGLGEAVSEHKRGVRPHAEVMEEARQLVESGMYSLDDVRELFPGVPMTDTDLGTLILSMHNLTVDMQKAAQRFVDSGSHVGSQEESALLSIMAMFAELDPRRAGARAEAGRALSFLNNPVSRYNAYLDEVRTVVGQGPDFTTERLAKKILAVPTVEAREAMGLRTEFLAAIRGFHTDLLDVSKMFDTAWSNPSAIGQLQTRLRENLDAMRERTGYLAKLGEVGAENAQVVRGELDRIQGMLDALPTAEQYAADVKAGQAALHRLQGRISGLAQQLDLHFGLTPVDPAVQAENSRRVIREMEALRKLVDEQRYAEPQQQGLVGLGTPAEQGAQQAINETVRGAADRTLLTPGQRKQAAANELRSFLDRAADLPPDVLGATEARAQLQEYYAGLGDETGITPVDLVRKEQGDVKPEDIQKILRLARTAVDFETGTRTREEGAKFLEMQRLAQDRGYEGHAWDEQYGLMKELPTTYSPALQAIMKTQAPGLWAMFMEQWRASLLGPWTWTKNILGNIGIGVWDIPVHFLAEQYGRMHEGGVVPGETVAGLYGFVHGMREMWAAMAHNWHTRGESLTEKRFGGGQQVSGKFRGDARLDAEIQAEIRAEMAERAANPPPPGEESTTPPIAELRQRQGRALTMENLRQRGWAVDPESRTGKFMDWWFEWIGFGNFGRQPFRILESSDEFFRMANALVERNRLAYADTVNRGLPTQAWADHAAAIATDPRLTAEINPQAFQHALEQTLQTPIEPGSLGAAFQGLARSELVGIPVGQLLLPFVKMPVNGAYFAIENSPLAAAYAPFYQAVRNGGREADIALARLTMGSLVATGIVGLVASGSLVGRAPDNPALREAWLREHPEYSMRLPNGIWVDYRIDPFGQIVAMVADAAQIMGEVNDNTAMERLVLGVTYPLMKDIWSQTGAKNVADFFAAMTPKPYEDTAMVGKNYIKYSQNLVLGIVPGLSSSTTRALVRATDPIQRDAETFMDLLYSKIPGWSSSVPARRTLDGSPVLLGTGVGPETLRPLIRAFTPHRIREEKLYPGDQAIVENGIKLAPPPKNLIGHAVEGNAHLAASMDLRTLGSLRLDAKQEEALVVLSSGDQRRADELGLTIPRKMIEETTTAVAGLVGVAPPQPAMSLGAMLDFIAQSDHFKYDGGQTVAEARQFRSNIFTVAVHEYRKMGLNMLFAHDKELYQRYQTTKAQHGLLKLPLRERQQQMGTMEGQIDASYNQLVEESGFEGQAPRQFRLSVGGQ